MKLFRICAFIFLIVVFLTGAFYIDHRISIYDMAFYAGKDDGILARLEWNCLISTIFYCVMTKRKGLYRILMALFGFITTILLSFATYLIAYKINDIFIHLVSFVLTVLCFYIIEFSFNKKKSAQIR
ncbi:MAG: hypothetical protein LBN95_07390 [Prevotellaceae bacterium]|jgi:hypothetical protein|nr:hypothetical protein [Prevotellaceae bacterium]